MKQSSYPIRKITKGNSAFYSVYIPAYLSPTGRKKYHYFHSRANAENVHPLPVHLVGGSAQAAVAVVCAIIRHADVALFGYAVHEDPGLVNARPARVLEALPASRGYHGRAQ